MFYYGLVCVLGKGAWGHKARQKLLLLECNHRAFLGLHGLSLTYRSSTQLYSLQCAGLQCAGFSLDPKEINNAQLLTTNTQEQCELGGLLARLFHKKGLSGTGGLSREGCKRGGAESQSLQVSGFHKEGLSQPNVEGMTIQVQRRPYNKHSNTILESCYIIDYCFKFTVTAWSWNGVIGTNKVCFSSFFFILPVTDVVCVSGILYRETYLGLLKQSQGLQLTAFALVFLTSVERRAKQDLSLLNIIFYKSYIYI